MASIKKLTISGYRNRPVPHSFLQQQQETNHLAILLPGMGYTAQMPLLYYPAQLMAAAGADIVRLEYDYRQTDFSSLKFKEQMQWLFDDTTAAYQAAMTQQSYQQLTLIGKSLGTLSMGHLLTTQPLPPMVKAVWLTPVLKNKTLQDQILQCGQPAFIAIGTADPYYDPEFIARLQSAPGSQIVTIEDADHGLNIKNNISGSIQVLQQIMEAMKIYLET